MPNPFKNLILDQEEREITQAVEAGKVKEVRELAKQKRRYQKYAKYTLDKAKNINLRLPERIIQRLKARAAAEGIPYQTLAASILHRYTTQTR